MQILAGLIVIVVAAVTIAVAVILSGLLGGALGWVIDWAFPALFPSVLKVTAVEACAVIAMLGSVFRVMFGPTVSVSK